MISLGNYESIKFGFIANISVLSVRFDIKIFLIESESLIISVCIFKEILVQDHFYMKYSDSHFPNNNYYIFS